jgi:hypothetical protein
MPTLKYELFRVKKNAISETLSPSPPPSRNSRAGILKQSMGLGTEE